MIRVSQHQIDLICHACQVRFEFPADALHRATFFIVPGRGRIEADMIGLIEFIDFQVIILSKRHVWGG